MKFIRKAFLEVKVFFSGKASSAPHKKSFRKARASASIPEKWRCRCRVKLVEKQQPHMLDLVHCDMTTSSSKCGTSNSTWFRQQSAHDFALLLLFSYSSHSLLSMSFSYCALLFSILSFSYCALLFFLLSISPPRLSIPSLTEPFPTWPLSNCRPPHMVVPCKSHRSICS